MSQHHRNAKHGTMTRTMRPRIQALVDAGLATCIRCGGPIESGQPWDVGHRRDLALDGDPNDVGPEHRTRVPGCPGNRNAGGRLGAQMVNTRRRTSRGFPSW